MKHLPASTRMIAPALLVAAMGPAQVVAVDVDRAIAELAVPARQWEASLALLRAGAAAVPQVRAVLQTHLERPATMVEMALLVAGRRGREAVSLLPDVLEVYRMGAQPQVRRQALWAVGQIAPFAPPQQQPEVQQFLLQHFAQGDRFLFACVDERIQIGDEHDVAALCTLLRRAQSSARVIAVAEAAAAALQKPLAADAELRQLLRELLAPRLERPLQPWDVDNARECEAAPLAAAAWAAGERSPLVARGLLSHWDPELRLAGLDVLANAEVFSRPERWDVVLRLWDPVPLVRDLSLATMQSWKDGFAMAIPTLLARSAEGDRAFAAACDRAIDRWAANASPVAATAVATLRGRQADGALPVVTAADRAMLTELVMGCRGLGNGEHGRLATFVSTHRLIYGPIVDAFLWCVATHDDAASRAAMQALVVLGPAVAALRPDLATLLVRSTVFDGARLETVGPVAEAWVRAGPAATPSELLTAIGSDNWCVTARALAEVLQRGAAPDRAIADAAAAARGRIFATVHVEQGRAWANARRPGSGYAEANMKPDHELIAALATLVLLAAGDERWRGPSVLQTCLLRCGGGATAESLRAALAAGELPALSRRLEKRLRPRWLEPR